MKVRTLSEKDVKTMCDVAIVAAQYLDTLAAQERDPTERATILELAEALYRCVDRLGEEPTSR